MKASRAEMAAKQLSLSVSFHSLEASVTEGRKKGKDASKQTNKQRSKKGTSSALCICLALGKGRRRVGVHAGAWRV